MGTIYAKYVQTKGPNADNKRVHDTIDVIRTQLRMARDNAIKLEENESAARQEQVQAEEERTRNDLEKGNSKNCLERFQANLSGCVDELENYEKSKSYETRQVKTSPDVSSAKKTKVAIQLYCAQKTDMTDYVMEEFKTKLTSQQFHEFLHGIKLTVETCTTPSCIKSGIPLIIICLNSSRLCQDLRNAISGVPLGSKAALAIFHHLKEHALPAESSNIILKKDDVGDVKMIVDVAFFEKMGLYECDMNRSAYNTLIKFIEGNFNK